MQAFGVSRACNSGVGAGELNLLPERLQASSRMPNGGRKEGGAIFRNHCAPARPTPLPPYLGALADSVSGFRFRVWDFNSGSPAHDCRMRDEGKGTDSLLPCGTPAEASACYW